MNSVGVGHSHSQRASAIKSKFAFHSAVEISASLVITLTLSGQDGRSSPRSGSWACRPCGRPGPTGSASRWRSWGRRWQPRGCWNRNKLISFQFLFTACVGYKSEFALHSTVQIRVSLAITLTLEVRMAAIVSTFW